MAGSDKQREEINRKLVTMQMEMIGLTYQDAVDTPEFWRVYTLTTEQTLEWRKAALPLIKKTFKCNKTRAQSTMGWFELNLGLREYNPEEIDTTYIHTTIPPEAHMLKDQQPTFLQKMKKFFRGYYD
jgi:hypothetical protein